MFGTVSKNLVARITKQLNPINLKNVIPGVEQINEANLKPRTKEFIQYKSNLEKGVYYRIGIIDFL